MRDELDRVVPLDELDDFQVAEGDPDVRGWDVYSADGRKIGEVENLLVDVAARKVRYLEVEVDREMLKGASDRHILVPIGYARLHEEDDQVMVDSLNSSDVMGLPEYQQGHLTREYESSVRERFDRGFTGPGPAGAGAEFYVGRSYDDAQFYGARRGAGTGQTGDYRAESIDSSAAGSRVGEVHERPTDRPRTDDYSARNREEGLGPHEVGRTGTDESVDRQEIGRHETGRQDRVRASERDTTNRDREI